MSYVTREEFLPRAALVVIHKYCGRTGFATPSETFDGWRYGSSYRKR